MKNRISCGFNIDTACVELKFADGTILSIFCPGVEDQVAENRTQRSELDWLIYNEPLTYAQLVLNGEIEAYLKQAPEHKLGD